MPAPVLKPSNLAFYADIMREIKSRLAAIRTTADLLNAGTYPHEPYMAAEFCLIQLRMICELFAVGCLVAHEKVRATRGTAFRELYNAEKIMAALGKLHADFYPVPVSLASQDGHHHATPLTKGFLTKKDLKSIYTFCLEFLHRGKVKDFLDGKRREYDWGFMIDHADKITRLLSIHYIKMADSQDRYVIHMHANAAGDVETYVIAPSES